MPAKSTLVIEVPVGELAARLAEAATGQRHPSGSATTAAIDLWRREHPQFATMFLTMADVAIDYFRDCCESAKQAS